MSADALRVVVVDDERLARRRLEALLARHPGVELVASCAGSRDALRVLDEGEVDCLFLDVEMPGGSGLELARRLRERDVAVVFVTAHAEHGAAAFDLDAVDYLLKPFDDARFAHSLEKVRQALAPPTAAPRAVPRLPVESNGRVRLLELETIDCIEADDKRVLLHTATGTHALRQGLRSLEERLDPVRFARIHRRFIVRLGAIVELGRAFHGDWIVTLRGGRQVVLSRRYRNRLKGLIEPL